jgi:hypothetical protein
MPKGPPGPKIWAYKYSREANTLEGPLLGDEYKLPGGLVSEVALWFIKWRVILDPFACVAC